MVRCKWAAGNSGAVGSLVTGRGDGLRAVVELPDDDAGATAVTRRRPESMCTRRHQHSGRACSRPLKGDGPRLSEWCKAIIIGALGVSGVVRGEQRRAQLELGLDRGGSDDASGGGGGLHRRALVEYLSPTTCSSTSRPRAPNAVHPSTAPSLSSPPPSTHSDPLLPPRKLYRRHGGLVRVVQLRS